METRGSRAIEGLGSMVESFVPREMKLEFRVKIGVQSSCSSCWLQRSSVADL